MSASGEASKRFRRLGFKDSKIYQFGYFPAFPHRPLQVRASGPFRLLCVGLIEPFKGQDLLLKAIYRLKEAGLPCHCTITGFGSMRDKCIKLRDKLQLQELVEFPGVVEQTELERLFATSDVLVAPGYEEPWGIRVNEGILAGLPVVVSNGVGAHEVVAAMHSGAVFRSASAASLASALDRVYNDLLSDPDSLLARVDRAGETIQPKVVAGYAAEIIRHALSGGAGPKPEAPWMKGAGRSAGKAL
jgi:glycosyltransferase involved in cell wall biosynthesis